MLILEILWEIVGEFFLAGLTYGCGYLVLKILSLGRLSLAGLSTFGQKSASHRWWSLNLWLDARHRVLRSEWVCFAGGLSLIAGFTIFYFTVRT